MYVCEIHFERQMDTKTNRVGEVSSETGIGVDFE